MLLENFGKDSGKTFKLINRLIGKNKNEHQILKPQNEESEVSESKKKLGGL